VPARREAVDKGLEFLQGFAVSLLFVEAHAGFVVEVRQVLELFQLLGEGLALLAREQQLLVEPFVFKLQVLEFFVRNTSRHQQCAGQKKENAIHKGSRKP